MNLDAMRTRLRSERMKRDWTLDEFAARSGVHRSAVHDIETNRKGHPRLETVAKLVEGLGLTLSAFFLQIEDSTTAPNDGKMPAPHELRAGSHEADPIPTGGGGDRATELAFFGALGSKIADSLVTAIDRAADRIIAAREQAPTTGAETPAQSAARRGRHRRVG